MAALLVDTDTSARQDLLRAVAWFPVTRLAPAAVHTAAFAWFWVMAAAPKLTVRAGCSRTCPTACSLLHGRMLRRLQTSAQAIGQPLSGAASAGYVPAQQSHM